MRRLYVTIGSAGVYIVSNAKKPYKSALSAYIGSKSEVGRYWPGIKRLEVGDVAVLTARVMRIIRGNVAR